MGVDEWTDVGCALVLDRNPFAKALVRMRVADVESMFITGRIEDGCEDTAGSRDQAHDNLVSGDYRVAPTITFSMPNPDQVRMRIFDGRHRFAVLRDAGAKYLNVGVRSNWAKFLVEAGLGELVNNEEGCRNEG